MGEFVKKTDGFVLGVNKDSEHHYVVEKDEVQGVKELRELAQSSSIEEAWFFIEGRDRDGKAVARWYEVGENEEGNKTTYDPFTLTDIRKSLEAEGVTVTKVTHYHIHPHGKNSRIDALKSGTPSSLDWHAHIKLNMLVDGNPAFRGLPTPTSRIVNESGVWSQETHVPHGKSEDRFINRVGAAISKLEDKRISWIMQCHRGEGDHPCQMDKAKVQSLSSLFHTPWTKLTFTPFEASSSARKTMDHHSKDAGSPSVKAGFSVRDTEGRIYDVYFNKTTKQTVLKNPVMPILYDSNGQRVGFSDGQGVFHFHPPHDGWSNEYPESIHVDDRYGLLRKHLEQHSHP